MTETNTATVSTFPAGCRSVLCLTFDLDAETMWTSKDPDNATRPAVLSSGRYDVGPGLDLVLQTLASRGLRTTFFVPTLVAATHQDAVRRIVDAGHEIAMHGDDHTPLRDRARSAEATHIRGIKDKLEDLAQTKVDGYRAPLYDVTEHTRTILAELDCTYSSNYMDSVHPYLVHTCGGVLAEIPVHWILDDGPHMLFSSSPPNHRQFITNSQVTEMWTAELHAIHELRGVATFTLHPQLVGRPSRRQLIDRILDEAETLGEVWYPTMAELAQHALRQVQEAG
jgi:peptidoglycan/xylan/chitin deacetylase (PgdA/CDA1 family)